MEPINKVYILPEVHQQIMGYVRNCQIEVSGLGVAEIRDNCLCITQAFILPQECTLGYTQFKKGALTEFVMNKVKERFDIKSIRFWWHSHVNGGTFWSPQDNQNIDNINNGGDYYVSTVFNKRGEMLTRIDLYNPFHIKVDQVETIVGLPVTKEDDEKYAEIIAKMVEDITPPTHKYKGNISPISLNNWKKGKENKKEEEEYIEDISFYISAALSSGEDLYELLDREDLYLGDDGKVYRRDS